MIKNCILDRQSILFMEEDNSRNSNANCGKKKFKLSRRMKRYPHMYKSVITLFWDHIYCIIKIFKKTFLLEIILDYLKKIILFNHRGSKFQTRPNSFFLFLCRASASNFTNTKHPTKPNQNHDTRTVNPQRSYPPKSVPKTKRATILILYLKKTNF